MNLVAKRIQVIALIGLLVHFIKLGARRMNPHKVFEVLAAVTALAAAIARRRAAIRIT
jgi:hypothetical protein